MILRSGHSALLAEHQEDRATVEALYGSPGVHPCALLVGAPAPGLLSVAISGSTS